MLATRSSCRLICLLTGGVLVLIIVALSLSQSVRDLLPKRFGPALSSGFSFSSNSSSGSSNSWTFDARRDGNNYGLTSDQCDSAFPGLFAEVDRVVQRRRENHITQEELTRDKWPAGTVRVLVWEQQVDSGSDRDFVATLALTSSFTIDLRPRRGRPYAATIADLLDPPLLEPRSDGFNRPRNAAKYRIHIQH